MPIIDKTDGYLDSVREFADSINMREQLEKELEYLAGYANGPGCLGPTRCYLYKDFAPHSFYFVMERKIRDGETDGSDSPRRGFITDGALRGPSDDPEWPRWFNGGLIFHGPHDGGGSGGPPTFSVCLTSTFGWRVHT